MWFAPAKGFDSPLPAYMLAPACRFLFRKKAANGNRLMEGRSQTVGGFTGFVDKHPLFTIAAVAVTSFISGTGAATWVLVNGYVPNQLYSLTKELEKYKNTPKEKPEATPAATHETAARTEVVEPARAADVSEQAMNAQRFIVKYDGLSQSERKQFLKNHDGETVSWDLVVLNSGYDTNGRVVVFCRASIKEQWHFEEAHPCFIVANPASEALALNLRDGDIIRINGVLTSSVEGIAATADLKLIGHCGKCAF